ncbi:hypothetical protein HS125_08495 [bacterium]|nr:hypothetical protein [bacterium]
MRILLPEIEMRRARRGLGLALAACLWAAGTAARGGDYTWVAPGAGSWSTASNWSPPVGPPRSAGDRAIFSASGGGNCTALLPVDCGTLEVRAGYAGTLAGLSLKFKQVFVGGGTVLAAVTCNGDVEYASGVLTSLILEGEGVFSGTNGAALFSLRIAPACIRRRIF